VCGRSVVRHRPDFFAAAASSRSDARDPRRMPSMPSLPSWQAYSYIRFVVRLSGTAADHGFVQAVRSVTVNSYSTVSASAMEKRSTSWRFWSTGQLHPLNWFHVLSLKLVVSTTNVSPSQWPRESPLHERNCDG